MSAATFTHTPRPANVSTGKHSYQRRFGPYVGEHLPPNITGSSDMPSAELSVYRDGENDVAELRLSIGRWTNACFAIRLTPSELREAAARLLDAAHDIEAFPAAVLKQFQDGSAP